jgi:ubiquinone/menaquinone biosynthesis C-methylase UbiE
MERGRSEAANISAIEEVQSMSARGFSPAGLVMFAVSLVTILLIATLPGRSQTQPAQGAGGSRTQAKKKVDPSINAPFQKARVQDFIKRFESDDREVYVKRHEITRALGLKPGMAVADIGAGTGLFTRLIADQVGPQGKVYAVDISKDFLEHIAAYARAKGQTQVVTIRGTQDSTNLPAGSVDLVFLCDVYHHLENHEKVLGSIHRALRPGGSLVLVEFDRVEGKSSDFVLKHIRAGQAEFRKEIESAGFEAVTTPPEPRLKDNFFARFLRSEGSTGPSRRSTTRGPGSGT